MASITNVKNVVVHDTKSGKEIPAELISERSNSSVFCDIIASRSKKVLGTMLLNLSGNSVLIATLKNQYEGRISHVGKEFIQYAKDLAAQEHLPGVATFAMYNSHAFYHSLGFKPLNDEAEKKILAAIELASKTGSKHADTKHIGGLLMRDYVEIEPKKKSSRKK